MLMHSRTDFMSDTPHFSIIGKSVGGPPTDYRWSKDGLLLTSNATFNITMAAIPQNMMLRYQHNMFESIITVTGREPGFYQYTVTNQVSTILADTTAIEGNNSSPNCLISQFA
jgi:hypothetical protein